MDDDDENEERGDDNDEDEEGYMRSYSKKSLFGRTSRDIKFLTVKTGIKFRHQLLKPVKLSIQGSMPKRGGAISTYFKLKHKQDVGPFVATSKINASLKNIYQLDKWDFSTAWAKKISNINLGVTAKGTSKKEFSCKLTQAYNFGNGWKWKSSLEAQKKEKGNIYSYNLNLLKKRFVAQPSWLTFISQYNELLGVSYNAKVNGKHKVESSFKGHVSTSENHKFYLEHKCSGEVGSKAPLINSITANYQDSLGIGTLNGFLSFEDKVLKTKEFRFVIESQKSLGLTFGVQKRNQAFELMFRKKNFGCKWLRQVQLGLGNKGFLATIEGKVKLWNLPVDYVFNYKLKQIKYTFYEDSSVGYCFKCNI